MKSVNPIELSDIFKKRSNKTDAEFMKKYMRNQFEFHGVSTDLRRKLSSEYFNSREIIAIKDLPTVIMSFWDIPERELQYAAIDLAIKYAKKAEEEFIALYEDMVLKKSWWDTVDTIAANLIGEYFRKFPEKTESYTGKWNKSDNIWLIRCAIIFQLKYKEHTDVKLLFKYIREHAGSKEFFIQKAIGWSLRQYSRIDSESVIEFVKKNELKPLSKNEALKWLERKKKGNIEVTK